MAPENKIKALMMFMDNPCLVPLLEERMDLDQVLYPVKLFTLDASIGQHKTQSNYLSRALAFTCLKHLRPLPYIVHSMQEVEPLSCQAVHST